jgi:hypothetical protein
MKYSNHKQGHSDIKQFIMFVFIVLSGYARAQDFVPSKSFIAWDKQRLANKKRNPTEVYYAKINRTFEITPHIYVDGKDTIISLKEIQALLQGVNSYFEPSGISFTTCTAKYFRSQALDTVSFAWWDNNLQDYLSKDYEPFTINMYFDKAIKDGKNKSSITFDGGKASPPTVTDPNHLEDYIFIAVVPDSLTVEIDIAHELGHFFGLYHPHDIFFGKEFVNESNCSTAGDLLCDTPAEPEQSLLNLVDADCHYTGNILNSFVDPNGDGYVPSTTNIMSYTPPPCVKGFTQQQFERMIMTYYQFRTYLR